jgi:hypothetical protein
MGNRGAVILVLAVACARSTSTFPARKLGLRITSAEFARKNSYHALHVDLPFQVAQHGVNGTALVVGYLQKMQELGALYVSDLRYALQMRHNGTPVECVSRIHLVDDVPPPSAEPTPANGAPAGDDGEPVYSTTVKPWKPGTSDQWVVDRDYKCKKHATQVVTEEPKYENSYSAEVRRYIPPGGMPIEDTPHIVYYDECALEPQKKLVHRYEHFLAAHFAPPDLAFVAKRYAEKALVEDEPLCHEITVAPNQPLRHHITADVHFDNDSIDVTQENVIVPEHIDVQSFPGGN